LLLHPIPYPTPHWTLTFAILGKKGRGKTFTAKGIVERLLCLGRRVLVLDPLSIWWGLKASADGKSPGYPVVIFGGPKADIPITSMSGHALGQLLAGSSISAVLDLGELRKGEQALLAADLLDHLFRGVDPGIRTERCALAAAVTCGCYNPLVEEAPSHPSGRCTGTWPAEPPMRARPPPRRRACRSPLQSSRASHGASAW
jgi:hypothetical protein